jgi:hypothetical protein
MAEPTKSPEGLINAPETMTELRVRCNEAFADLWNGHIPGDRAKELANLAGKIIKSASIQVEYAGLRKEKPEIPFLK